jgi:thiazole/oxazole-forming peptide maturase SagD family component
VPVQALLGFSETQYARRKETNLIAGQYAVVPEPLCDQTVISWTRAWSLTDERERLIPSAYCFYGHPDMYEHRFCYTDSNGNAAGNTLEEAILQGFCELFERDAVGLWWYNRIRHRGFDMDSIDEPYIDTLREFYATIQRDIWMLDLTTDIGIPTFAALSRRTDHPVEDVLLGFGAHPDVRIAALRALTEMNQFLPIVAKRHPDGSTDYWIDDKDALAWWSNTRVADEPWLLPDPQRPSTTAAGYGRIFNDDMGENVRLCVDRARRAGLEAIVLDQSRPDIELRVAKVMVPGLQHFWRRLAPGRLYDVPVELGWLPDRLREDQLNPLSVFF